MQQAPFDLRDYVLGELDGEQAAQVERFLAGSAAAREEVERLKLTRQALESLPEEAPPQRIAFVSDKVFEPSAWARFRRWAWTDGPRLAFGAAACLAVLFAGIAVTEPRVTVAEGSWELAFGPAPSPAAAEAPGLDEAAVRAVVSEAVAAAARDREEIVKLVADRVGGSEAAWRQALSEHREDAETGLILIGKRFDELEKTQLMMAGVR